MMTTVAAMLTSTPLPREGWLEASIKCIGRHTIYTGRWIAVGYPSQQDLCADNTQNKHDNIYEPHCNVNTTGYYTNILRSILFNTTTTVGLPRRCQKSTGDSTTRGDQSHQPKPKPKKSDITTTTNHEKKGRQTMYTPPPQQPHVVSRDSRHSTPPRHIKKATTNNMLRRTSTGPRRRRRRRALQQQSTPVLAPRPTATINRWTPPTTTAR